MQNQSNCTMLPSEIFLDVPMSRPQIFALIYLTASLLLGLFIAYNINAYLGIEFNPKTLPQIPTYQARTPESLEPIDPIAAIVIPQGAMRVDSYRRAVDVLVQVIAQRSGKQPLIIEVAQTLPEGGVIAVGDHSRNDFVEQSAPALKDPDAFALRAYRQDGRQVLAVLGASPMGDIYGMYRLADELRARNEEEVFSLDQTYYPALSYRFVDMGAVGIPYDPAGWDPEDYSHHDHAYEDVILPTAPYIDEAAFLRVEKEFKDYIQRMIAYGNNGLVFSGFLEFVNFDTVGNGYEIYDQESEYRERHRVLRDKFGTLFEYAHENGMKIVLKTDMVALTAPLEAYFNQRLGGVEASNPQIWEVYRQGLEELFEQMPYVDGLMIRIGEAGAIYNLEGWDYYSQLYVRDVDTARNMLRAFLNVAEAHDKLIIFRSWSVGIGEVGDMHTNPDSYNRLLGDLNSPNLVVSTKYAMGDYYSYLPLNPTLENGEQLRIIEFQARREFEGFNAFPNYVGPLYQTALQELRSKNLNIRGTWLWTQGGGPVRAGPLSLYPFHGFWQLIDANVYVTSRLAWDPDANLDDLTETWARRNFGADPRAIQAVTEMLYLSPEAMRRGLYIGEFARQQVLAMGLEPPPMMWIFEWDIVGGASATLIPVYQVSKPRLGAAVAEGFQAVELVRQMRASIAGIDPKSVPEPALLAKLRASLNYEADLFETLAWYRKAFLYLYRWVDSGDRAAYRNWEEAFAKFQVEKKEHLAKYDRDLDFPAYNFFEEEAGMAHAERSLLVAWLARLVLLITGAMYLGGTAFVQARMVDFPGKSGLRALWSALVTPWDLSTGLNRSPIDLIFVTLLPLLLIAAGFLVFSSLRSPHFVGWMFLSMLGFAGALVLLAPRGARGGIILPASILSPLLLVNVLFMLPVAVRGPLYFWLRFWINPLFRSVFITLGVTAGLWLFFSIFMGIRSAYGIPRLPIVGDLLIALGAMLVINGLEAGRIGLDSALTALNNEMAIMPLALSKILGITTHLGIPADLPFYAAGFGGFLILLGGLTRWLPSAITNNHVLH